MIDLDVLKTKEGTTEHVVPILYMNAEQLSTLAGDETQPYYVRKIIEMISSDNPSISMQAIKYLRDEEKKLKSTKQDPHPITDIIALVTSLGSKNYRLSKILNIIPDDIDKDEFTQQFNDPTHPINKAYNKGIDIGDYDIDNTLLYIFKSEGDLSALEKYEQRKRIRMMDDD